MTNGNENKWFDWVIGKIREVSRERFYGKLILSFEAGKLVHLKREETMKPPKAEG